jgi:hypothetical protein
VPGAVSCSRRRVPCAFVDEISGKHFLVDTGASFCILPHHSQSPTSGPRLFGPSGQLIPFWSEQFLHNCFQGRDFSWSFLLASVDFAIFGVDFLKHHGLLVDPAKCRLDDGQGASLAALQLPSPPTASVVTSLHTPVASVAQVNSTFLSPSVVAAYQRILLELPDLVNESKRLPPVSHQVVRHIVTTSPPIAARFRRLDGEKLQAAKAEFRQLKAHGIIQRSTSPWASPLHMVQKKDGSWRPLPLPIMMDFAAKAAGCTVFSKVDLRKGYHQIPVNPADVPKTAITTPFGLFEYKRLPFGLQNAGASFQRHMDRAIEQVEAAFAFVDDMLVCSMDHAAHQMHLR